MRTGAPRHPKVSETMAILQLERYSVVGLLEMLWHFTSEFYPGGDVGKCSDAVIADALGWKGDPARLMSGLVGLWLDPHPVHRLVVHDWQDHAPDYIRKRLKRMGKEFVSSTIASDQSLTSQRPSTDQSMDVSTQPNPTQPNPTQPSAAAPVGDRSLADELPHAAAAVVCQFPAVSAGKLTQIFAAVRQKIPDAGDEEIAAAVPIARFSGQKTAAGFRVSLPQVVFNRRAELARKRVREQVPDEKYLKDLEYLREIIADPRSPPAEIEWARKLLKQNNEE